MLLRNSFHSFYSIKHAKVIYWAFGPVVSPFSLVPISLSSLNFKNVHFFVNGKESLVIEGQQSKLFKIKENLLKHYEILLKDLFRRAYHIISLNEVILVM